MPQVRNQVTAIYNASRGSLVGFLQPESYDRRVVLMAIRGPQGSTLTGYHGYTPDPTGRLFAVYPASDRTYDSVNDQAPIMIHAGEAATFEWTGGGTAPGQTASAAVTSQWGRD